MPLPGTGDDVADGRVAGFPLEVFAGFVHGGDERGGIACAGGVVFGGDEVASDLAAGLEDFKHGIAVAAPEVIIAGDAGVQGE